jgi:hypothetical protein
VIGRQDDAGVLGRLDHGTGVPDGQGKRLLAQDVPPRTDGGDRLLGVPVVRRADVDGVDLGIGQQPGQGLVAALDPVPPGVGRAPLRRPAVHGDDATARLGADPGDDRGRGDVAGSDEPPPHAVGHPGRVVLRSAGCGGAAGR